MTRTDLTGEGSRQKVPGSWAEGSRLPGRRFRVPRQKVLGSPALDLAEKKRLEQRKQESLGAEAMRLMRSGLFWFLGGDVSTQTRGGTSGGTRR